MVTATKIDSIEDISDEVTLGEQRVSDGKDTYANLAKGVYEVVVIEGNVVGIKRIEGRPNPVTTYLPIERFRSLRKKGEEAPGLGATIKKKLMILV